ncbi:uncharacterized protein LOC129568453 [Sitodiplosis mosellana]|uniref:uncharacterized protein LOC129568453 n=1 Tax=Sitodiplosis mosellana TaxID=263140 RepID=UPI002444798D|nr:uncharacterized protein LOC129568453 [Sitodiplosis mosellana]
MMSNIFLALVILSSATKMCTGLGMWSFDQQLVNPVHTISNHGNSNDENLVYIPVAKYPVKYRESTNNEYTNENAIQKPTNNIITPPSTDFRHTPHMTRSQTASYQLQRERYNRRPVLTSATTTVRSHFDSPIQEYLLHAQMPLPNAKTFIMINRYAKVEPEFLT